MWLIVQKDFGVKICNTGKLLLDIYLTANGKVLCKAGKE